MLAEIVAENLRRLRAERGLTQEQMAIALGVHRTWIGALENADRNLSLRTLERTAALYGVSPLELLYGPTMSDADLTAAGAPPATPPLGS